MSPKNKRIVSGRLFCKDQAILDKALDNIRNAFSGNVLVEPGPGDRGDPGARITIYVPDL